MSEFVTNMFQYDVTVGITRSEVILAQGKHSYQLLQIKTLGLPAYSKVAAQKIES